ncbi:transporter [Comamonas serinivorans]|uniref:Transporter n=1 Tax=Comamonas serinivorans TaxID=1082851 RepID=A0A1Y0ELP8_9BURK|nr:TolC family protein [Comamonas serinivorans]ARU04361.1 transporter [Comamonas serinivorans]
MQTARLLPTLVCATALALPTATHGQSADLQLAPQLTPGSLASSSAQQQLLQALHAMLGEHPDVLRARAALESAGHDLDTAKGARWPSLKIGTSSGSAQVGQGARRESYNSINAEVRMKLLDGGAINAGIRSAESQESAQTSVLYSTRQNVLLEALTALFELHRFDRKTRIAAESAAIIGQLARVEERRAELGAVGRNDLRQAASRRSSALSQQHALEAQRTDAQARFVRYFNYHPGKQGLPQPQLPVHWLPASEEAARQAAEAQSSELQEANHQIERAQAEVERAKAERWPTVAAVVSHARDPKGVLYTEGTRYGVELNWNFGNGFELRDRILKATNELQSQLAQQETVRRAVHETVTAAWGRWQAGRERETQLHEAVREARGAFEGYRRLLEMGRGSLSQVLDAQLDMQRLMLDEADAIYDQHINALRLARTTGQLLPRDLPAHWLDQLFAPATQSAQAQARPDQPPAASVDLALAPVQLKLATRLDPQGLSWPGMTLPAVASGPSGRARW